MNPVRIVDFGYTINLTPSPKGTLWYWSVDSERGQEWSSVESTFAQSKEAALAYRDALRDAETCGSLSIDCILKRPTACPLCRPKKGEEE